MSKCLELLKRKIASHKTLDDEVLAILVSTGESQISTDRAMIHSAFQKMRSNCKLLQISHIVFDLSTIFPYSEELEMALFRLEASENLEYYFCDDPYYIMEGVRSQSSFNGEERGEISNCALVLQKALRAHNNK